MNPRRDVPLVLTYDNRVGGNYQHGMSAKWTPADTVNFSSTPSYCEITFEHPSKEAPNVKVTVTGESGKGYEIVLEYLGLAKTATTVPVTKITTPAAWEPYFSQNAGTQRVDVRFRQ